MGVLVSDADGDSVVTFHVSRSVVVEK
jgi:hypothetical protein